MSINLDRSMAWSRVPIFVGDHAVIQCPAREVALKDESVDCFFFDTPGLEDRTTVRDYQDFLDPVFRMIDRVGKNDCALILVPRDRKGHPFEKSTITAYTAYQFGWQNFRRYAWHTGYADYNRARYAYQPVWTMRKGNKPAQPTNLRWTDVINVVDEHDGGMVMSLPEQLILQLLSLFCLPGDVVMDPFAGSGSVMRVADRMDLKSISVELDIDRARQLLLQAKEIESGRQASHQGTDELVGT